MRYKYSILQKKWWNLFKIYKCPKMNRTVGSFEKTDLQDSALIDFCIIALIDFGESETHIFSVNFDLGSLLPIPPSGEEGCITPSLGLEPKSLENGTTHYWISESRAHNNNNNKCYIISVVFSLLKIIPINEGYAHNYRVMHE